MMYDEFITKTGIQIDYNTYIDKVEVVYRQLPEMMYGTSNTDFCNWVKTHGGMDIIFTMYPLCMNMEDSGTRINQLKKENKELQDTIEGMDKEITELNNALMTYEAILPKEKIVEMLVEKCSKGDLINLLAKYI